jgi:hypothetical protein
VLAVRARLEANPWAQVGAPAIAWELEKLGAVVPAPRTIERILGRAGVTVRPRPGRRTSKGIAYPAPAAERPGDVVQVDLVGPRHLDARGRRPARARRRGRRRSRCRRGGRRRRSG